MPPRRATALRITVLTTLALFLHGWHPLSEDGGLYVAGVKALLNPALFPHDRAFVTAHLHYSVFAPLLAATVRTLHVPLTVVLFLAYLVTVAATFFAFDLLLGRLELSPRSRDLALVLLCAWWTLPLAGTSLFIADPYLTGRSFALPLTLFAATLALDPWAGLRKPSFVLLTLIAAALFHPLMAIGGTAFVILIRLEGAGLQPTNLSLRSLAMTRFEGAGLQPRRSGPQETGALAPEGIVDPISSLSWKPILITGPVALLLANMLTITAPAETGPANTAALSRSYWYLARWEWFEWIGLIVPLAVLITLAMRRTGTEPLRQLRIAAIILGLTALTLTLLFARQSMSSHAVARLQPLRTFLFVYLVLLIDLTALAAASRRRFIAAALPVLSAAALALVSRVTYSNSPHIEWPGLTNRNPWMQAFLWIRDNTPTDAVVSTDAYYVNRDGEAGIVLRAAAERSALPDWSKDGGESAITPALAATWLPSATAQIKLSAQPDALRTARLRTLGATWVVLDATAATTLPCPYTNSTVKVCRLTLP